MSEAFVSSRPSLKVDGQQREDLQEALTALTVNLPLNGSAHAELHATNLGREGSGDQDYIFNDIALGARLEVLMGQDNPVRIFAGEITAIEERYGEGAPGLVLLVQDTLHRLARARHSRTFEDRSPDAVVQSIAADAGLQPDANVSSLSGTWHQLNESDLAFLLRLLGRFDIALRLDGGRLRAKPEEPDPNPVDLDAQDSALSVRLIADLNHQPRETRVQGYNPGSAEAVDHATQSLSPAPAGTAAYGTLANLGWAGDETVPQPFPLSGGAAEAYATAHFRRQAKRFIHGDIVCQGEAGLRSGREIRLAGVSPRLRGLYQVVHCVHRFDNVAGYETHLKVNRAGWQP